MNIEGLVVLSVQVEILNISLLAFLCFGVSGLFWYFVLRIFANIKRNIELHRISKEGTPEDAEVYLEKWMENIDESTKNSLLIAFLLAFPTAYIQYQIILYVVALLRLYFGG